MYQESDIRAQLEKCFYGDDELRKSSFMKFGAKISQNIEKYDEFFIAAINGHDVQLKKGVLYLFKVMTTEEYLIFTSPFVQELFRILIQKAMDGSEDEMELSCLMLVNYQMRAKYLPLLSQNFYHEYQNEANFSVLTLQRLMSNILLINQGKIKGPDIKQQYLNELYDKALNYTISRMRKKYKRPDDRKTFLSVCCHVIGFTISFKQKMQVAPFLHTIWQYYIDTFEGDQFQVVNQLFRFMRDLFRLNDSNYIQQLQENYLKLLPISTQYGLQCGMISKFWNSYIKKLGRFNDLGKIDSLNISLYCCLSFMKPTSQINEIGQKLAIIDNIILMNEIKTQMHQYQNIKNSLIQICNPENNQTDKLFMLGIQALYSNFFTIQKNKEFQYAVTSLKVGALQSDKSKEVYYICLRQIPVMKILLLKSPNFIQTEQTIENLISFLFAFLHDKESSHYFEDFIDLICKEVKNRLSHTHSEKKISQRIVNIVQNCQKYLLSNCQNLDISSHINCIQKLSALIFGKKQKITIFMNYLELIRSRKNSYEENLFQATSKIIKQIDQEPFYIQLCIKRLCQTIFQNNRQFYMELVFDFLETYKNHQVVWRQIEKHHHIIFKPSGIFDIKQILKSLNCQILMIQNDRNLSHCEDVQISLSKIVVDIKRFDPETYKKIISIIQKQRNFMKLQHCQHEAKAIMIARNTIQTLMRMLMTIEQTIQQNDTLTNAQKSEVYLDICMQIYNHSVFICNHEKFREQKDKIGAKQFIQNISNKFSRKPNYYEIQLSMKSAAMLLQLKYQNQTGQKITTSKPNTDLKQLHYLLSIVAKGKKRTAKTNDEKRMEQNFVLLVFELYAMALNSQ